MEQGNINLNDRPKVKNPDGSYSTVRSISIDEDGKSVLIPTVIGNKVVSNQEAISSYKKTGQHLGKFDSEDEATSYAKQLHNQQAISQNRSFIPRYKNYYYSSTGYMKK